MEEETLQERQDNEFEVLQSIFGEAVVDNRPNIAWKIWRPLDLLLTLEPLHSTHGVHCSVTLHIKCCDNYPNKPPSIMIHKLTGLSNENGAKLLDELECLSEKLCGEVMIYSLAEHVQNFLIPYNRPTLSFYEEMLLEKKETERLKLEDKQTKENEERQKMKEEIKQRKQVLREADRQRRQASVSQSESMEQEHPPELVYYADNRQSPAKKANRIRSFDGPCTCDTKSAQQFKLSQKNRKVHIGKCFGHSSNGAATCLSIDIDNNCFYLTKKWSLKPALDIQSRNRKLTLIEQDLKSMSRLKHPSLVPYVAMETQQEVYKRTTMQCIYIFRDYIHGVSLKYLRKMTFGDSFKTLKLLRHVGVGVLSALKELHGVGVVHRDVRCENVYLDDSGAVKLVDASLDVRLAEILDEDNYSERQTKAQDIFATGQLLLSLVSDDVNSLEIPPHLPGTAKDFFSRCLTEDETVQWPADRLAGHVFLLESAPVARHCRGHGDQADSGDEEEDNKLTQLLIKQNLPSSDQRRLNKDFNVLKWLGKGAFGDVLKVRNKLDGGFYAIKRIKLNPENVQLNRKMTREVTLLSRLSHENVVRYYNAWIESEKDDISDDSSGFSEVKEAGITPQNPVRKPQKTLDAAIAKLAPAVKLEWSISDAKSLKKDVKTADDEEEDEENDDDDDEDEDDGDGWFKNPTTQNEASSSIVFEANTSNQTESIPELPEDPELPEHSRPPTERIEQFLYIQMEFCEKNTLRHAIDNGLYLEHYRAWKLFREIVEGLAHVHQKGMIHRDLKPVNIFLDSNDHVKIGDFGLATKAFGALLPAGDEKERNQEEFGGSLTGQVGTALYVAPELIQQANKVIYNQKVDLYSLGIILFEMSHRPLETGMERIKVLSNLRLKDIVMPEKFICEENAKQVHLIRWLLDHEPSRRPNCGELLSSEHLPRTVHEGALSGLIEHALRSRGTRSYYRLINACLDQKPSPVEDYTFHSGLKTRPDLRLTEIKESVTRIFKSHGATEYTPPLLLPRAQAWDQYPNAVKVMTSSGSVCHLPHDLRLPFARQIAYTEIRNMRRYTVDRVFREKHADCVHPRELIECAFDIVTPRNAVSGDNKSDPKLLVKENQKKRHIKDNNLWPDAELLVVAYKAATAANLKVTFTLNHTEMLELVMSCCGITRDKHYVVYSILSDVMLGRISSVQKHTHLSSLCISDQDVFNLESMMKIEAPLDEIRTFMSPLVTKLEEGRLLTRIIGDITTVVKNAQALGLECPVTITPCLGYNATQHNGLFWQMSVVREDRGGKTKHRSSGIIAAGGRYDALVSEFWKVACTEKDEVTELPSVSVGLSLSLERMAAIDRKGANKIQQRPIQPTKVCVCITGSLSTSTESGIADRSARLARDLWTSDHTVALCYTNSAYEAHELTGASIVLLNDETNVNALHWDDNNRVREHRLPFIEVLDFVRQKLNPESAKSAEGASRTAGWSDDRSEKTNLPNVSVTFVTNDDKVNKNSRRHIENQIACQVSSSLMRVGVPPVTVPRARVCGLAVACPAGPARALASLAAPRAKPPALDTVLDTFPRHRKILEEAISALEPMLLAQNITRANDEINLIAIYSITDSRPKFELRTIALTSNASRTENKWTNHIQ